MTALSADKKSEYKEGVEANHPVDDGDTMYAGALSAFNADGYLVPGSDTAGLVFAGVSLDYGDNSDGVDGDVSVRVRRKGVYKMTISGTITQANVGNKVFLVDDQTVGLAATTTNDIFCGVIVEYIDSTHAYVDIEPAVNLGRNA